MAWDLYGDNERPSRDEIKRDKARESNRRQKSMMKIVGENLASYACVMIFVLLIGFIWTDIGILMDPLSFLLESLVTVILFVLADICAAQIGTKSGKFDDEYIKIHKEFLSLRDVARKAGLVMMDIFCAWQIDVEYDFYVGNRCRELKVDLKEYKRQYEGKSYDELKELLPKGRKNLARELDGLNQTRRIDLTPDAILTDGGIHEKRGGVPISGEEYIEKHTIGFSHIVITVIFAILAAIPTFTLTEDTSLGRVIYTLFKLAMMCYRMYQGFSRGSKGYNTIEPKHLQAKIKYLHLYLEFLEKKIYLGFGDKYGEIPLAYRAEAKEDEVAQGQER